MKRLDLKKALKHLYNPSAKEVVEVMVPPMQFIIIDGQGDPNHSTDFQVATEMLYGLSYTLKFASKANGGIDYTVMPLEGLWWMDDMGEVYGEVDFTRDKSRWQWTVMVMQPDHITPAMFAAAVESLRKKKNPPALDKARFEWYDEGWSAQIMHVGPYSAEKPTIDRIHAYIAERSHQPRGKHHEIYVGDPRKSAPEKLKTVIRQPMRKLS